MNKEEIEKEDNYWKGYIEKQKESIEICKMCKYRKRYKELEQKEAILDKVTDKLKEPITDKNIDIIASKLFKIVYKDIINLTKEKVIDYTNEYRKNLLNIIEGEKE